MELRIERWCDDHPVLATLLICGAPILATTVIVWVNTAIIMPGGHW